MRYHFCHNYQFLETPGYEEDDKLMRIETTKHNGDCSPYCAKINVI